jgi:hypothetical protein
MQLGWDLDEATPNGDRLWQVALTKHINTVIINRVDAIRPDCPFRTFDRSRR